MFDYKEVGIKVKKEKKLAKRLLANNFIYNKTHFIKRDVISLSVKPAFEEARFISEFNLIISNGVDCVISFSQSLNEVDKREQIINDVANYLVNNFFDYDSGVKFSIREKPTKKKAYIISFNRKPKENFLKLFNNSDFNKIEKYEENKLKELENVKIYDIENNNKLYSLHYSNIKIGLTLEQAESIVKGYQDIIECNDAEIIKISDSEIIMKESEDSYRYVSINKLINSGNKYMILINNIYPIYSETESSKAILRKKQIAENLDMDIKLIRDSVFISNTYSYSIAGELKDMGYQSTAKYCNNLCPELNIECTYKEFKGIPTTAMIFVNNNNNVLDTFLNTGSSGILKELKRIGNTYKNQETVTAYYKTIYYKEFEYNEPILASIISPSWIDLQNGVDKIKSVTPNESDGLWSLSKEKHLSGFEKMIVWDITKPNIKWLNEWLVLQYTKELYKEYEVIYQYRPFWLKRVSGGQMSYDVYIPHLRIAIEYQGKQHFEPIEFFGGIKSHEACVRRDREKLISSIENNIKLIYINFDEKLTKTLLKKKIDKVIEDVKRG